VIVSLVVPSIEGRADRRFRAHCGGELLIWFGAPIRHFCSVTGVN
jgi:hypothetical protein